MSFVEAARSDTNWAKAQSVMTQAGGWVFSVGLDVLKQMIAQGAMAAITRPR